MKISAGRFKAQCLKLMDDVKLRHEEIVIKPSAIRVVEEAAHFGLVGVSAISVWEVAMLEAKGRIRLSKDRLSWVHEALRAPGIG